LRIQTGLHGQQDLTQRLIWTRMLSYMKVLLRMNPGLEMWFGEWDWIDEWDEEGWPEDDQSFLFLVSRHLNFLVAK